MIDNSNRFMTVNKPLNKYQLISSYSRVKQQQGMTLIELTVVLLILTSLATIALRSTTGLVEQTKWEETKKRHEEIKKAIIGDPDLVINDQPDISGFVADMGRLPKNIRELLSNEYCSNDYTATTATTCASGTWEKQNLGYCESDYTLNQASCPSADWNSSGLAAPATSKQLGFGWKGPYLITSLSYTDKFAFADGWGRYLKDASDNPDVSDVNYGWNYDATGTPNLILQSCGKNYLCSTSDDEYDKDYPENPTAITVEDWMVGISSGVDVNIRSITNQGYCDVSTITNGDACVSAGWKWPGGFKCVDPITFTEVLDTTGLPYADYGACSAVSMLWKWSPFQAGCYEPLNAIGTCAVADWVDTSDYCSDPSKISQALCVAPAIWHTGNCTYPLITDKATCTTLPSTKKWAECTDTSIANTQSKSVCETHGATWSDVVEVCLRVKYRGLNSVIAEDLSTAQVVHSANNMTYKFNSIATVPTTHLPAGKAMFEVKHFVAGACTDLSYPQSYCHGGITSTQCTSAPASSTNKWEQACYGVTESYCGSKSGTFTPSMPTICKGITALECTSPTAATLPPTPAGVMKGTCYGDGLNTPVTPPSTGNYCTNNGGTLISSTLIIPPVVKTIIPHKATPQINW